MPCIMGLSPYASEVDIQISKQRQTIDVETASTRPGNVLESVLVGLTAKRLRARPSRANLFRVSERNPIFGATHDAWIVGRPTEAIETKFVGGYYADQWGEDGSSEVPPAVLVQAQMQMYVSDLSRVWVGAGFASMSFEHRVYPIDRDNELIESLVDFGSEWWKRHIVEGEPCTGDCRTDILRRVVREAGKVAQIDAGLIASWDEAKKALKLAIEAEEAAKNAVLLALGDAEYGDYGDAEKILTYRLQNSTPRTDFARMKADGVFELYCSQGQHRTLRKANRPKELQIRKEANEPDGTQV